MIRTMSSGVALALLLLACSRAEVPDDDFDGNVVIGDATSFESRDASRASEDAGDAGRDAASDAGASDAAPEDTRGDAGDAGDPCLLEAILTLSATAAALRSEELDGQIVDVVGTAREDELTCTEIACSPAEPCCNTCMSSLAIDGALPLSDGACTSGLGCRGSECVRVCRPPSLGVVQTFRGRLRGGAARGPHLELFAVEP